MSYNLRQSESFTKGSVKHVFKLRLSISGICNYRCIFCHNEGRSYFERKFMSIDDVMLLCYGAYETGIQSFTFTGGEPLTHPKAFDIIKNVRQTFPDVTLKLTTNALLLNIKDISFLEENIDKIRINFQCTDSKSIKNLVGIDQLDHLFPLIKELGKTKIHICLNYVYNNKSNQFLPDVVEFALQNSFEIKVLELIKNPHNEQYYEPIENAKQFLESIATFSKKDYQDDDLYFVGHNSPKIRLCYSHCNSCNGVSCRILGELRTSPLLDIYPCMHPQTPIINVKGKNVEEISEAILALDLLKGQCPEAKQCPKL